MMNDPFGQCAMSGPREGTVDAPRVEVTPEARAYVLRHGGHVRLWLRQLRGGG